MFDPKFTVLGFGDRVEERIAAGGNSPYAVGTARTATIQESEWSCPKVWAMCK